MNKPNPLAPWGFTVAIILNLLALVFMSAADTSINTLIIFGACEGGLILYAVALWKKYFEKLIRHEIQNKPAG